MAGTYSPQSEMEMLNADTDFLSPSAHIGSPQMHQRR